MICIIVGSPLKMLNNNYEKGKLPATIELFSNHVMARKLLIFYIGIFNIGGQEVKTTTRVFKKYFWSIGIIILSLLVCSTTYAGTCGASNKCIGSSPWAAASASYADVNYCVNTCATTDGEIINIPAGTPEWSSTLTVTKAVKIIGAGAANTIIKSTLTTKQTNGLIQYNPTIPDTAHRFRISGITFDGNNTSNIINIVNDSTTAEHIRIDNNKFLDPGYSTGRKCIMINGTVFGVIDNNIFDKLDYGTNYDVVLYALGSGSPVGKTQWDGLNASLDIDLGSANNLYFEDNIITTSSGNRIMHGHGGRSVIRYNTFQAPDAANTSISNLIDIHGNQGTYAYATMITEIYGNSANFGSLGTYLTDHRGGQSLQFYNNITSSAIIRTAKVREEFDDATVPETNIYTQRVNNTYYFGNRKKGTTAISGYQGDQCSDSCGYEIEENNNWFTERTGIFDGTGALNSGGGVGCGTLTARPTTCTKGVAYWVPNASIDPTASSCSNSTNWVGANNTFAAKVKGNTGTLYKCTATNTWTAYYKPYTYPHPLRTGDTATANASAISAPSGLRVVSN